LEAEESVRKGTTITITVNQIIQQEEPGVDEGIGNETNETDNTENTDGDDITNTTQF